MRERIESSRSAYNIVLITPVNLTLAMISTKNGLTTALIAVAIGASLVIAIAAISMQEAEAQLKFTRRVTGSWVVTSVAHNAEGHSSHQVVHFFGPQTGAIYDGKITFTSSKGVDIIAYHDITNQTTNTTSLKTWKVDGKTYAITPLLTNATAGTVDFVGAGLLAHSATSDPYTVVYTADGLAKKTASSLAGSMTMNGQGKGSIK